MLLIVCVCSIVFILDNTALPLLTKHVPNYKDDDARFLLFTLHSLDGASVLNTSAAIQFNLDTANKHPR